MAVHICIRFVLTLCFASWGMAAIAKSLPAASRTAYRCEADGKVTYSDAPCLGAKKVELEPTRGLNAGGGVVTPGADVRHERESEMFAEAVRPVTGMDAKQLATFGRRSKLAPGAQQACLKLDRDIPTVEAEEKNASKASLLAIQSRLLALRSRYRELRC